MSEKDCINEIEEAYINISKLEALETDPDYFIYEYFQEIKRNVDWRREELKLRIDICSEEIIQSIESTKGNCIKLSKEINQLSNKIIQSKTELNELVQQFGSLNKDQQKLEDVINSLVVINQNFIRLQSEYKDSLLVNKEYTFRYQDIKVDDFFGSFEEMGKYDSAITDIDLQNQLYKLCEFPVNQKLELKYRATRDGFKSKHFHSRCDGISNTLTVIKSTSGNIFGAFTERPWASNVKYFKDPNSFVFSLVNKENRPFKVMCLCDKNSICCYANYGPSFGGDDTCTKDIFINSDSNTNQYSYCNFGHSYKHEDYLCGTDRAKAILAGSYQFQTVEIEVFAKVG